MIALVVLFIAIALITLAATLYYFCWGCCCEEENVEKVVFTREFEVL